MRRFLKIVALPILIVVMSVINTVMALRLGVHTWSTQPWTVAFSVITWPACALMWTYLLGRDLRREYQEDSVWLVFVQLLNKRVWDRISVKTGDARAWQDFDAQGYRYTLRTPDQVIYNKGHPYLIRWWVFPWSRYMKIAPSEQTRWQRFVNGLRLPAIYIHLFMQDDDDRATHDHPWANISIPLWNGYWEWIGEYPTYRLLRRRGQIIFRRAKYAHRIELCRDGTQVQPALSLFITGFKTRSWGFWCPGRRWVPWREYTNPNDTGLIGKGCDA